MLSADIATVAERSLESEIIVVMTGAIAATFISDKLQNSHWQLRKAQQ